MDLRLSTCKIQMTTLRWIIMLMMMRRGESMRLDLESGMTKCISDDIKLNYLTVGTYSVVNPNEALHLPDSHKIFVTVASPKGHTQHQAEKVESGKFVFTAVEDGDYTTCFIAPVFKPPAKFAVDFEWKSGVEAKDWATIAKRGQINMLDVEVRKLLDVTESIHDEMFLLRERYPANYIMHQTNLLFGNEIVAQLDLHGLVRRKGQHDAFIMGYCSEQGAGNAGAKPVDELKNGGSKFIFVVGYVFGSRYTAVASEVILGEEEASLIKHVIFALIRFCCCPF